MKENESKGKTTPLIFITVKSKWRTETEVEVITTEFQFCAKNDKRTQIWHD